MKQRLLIILSVISIVFILASCEQAQPEQQLTQSVNITLANVADPNARTIRPDHYESPDKYDVTLTEVSAAAEGVWTEVPGSEKTKTWNVDASGNSITLDNVAVGNYKVSIIGLTDADVKVLSGSSNDVLSVTPGSVNSITIDLSPIEEGEGLTGTVRIDIDWTQAKGSDRFNELFEKGLTVKMKDLKTDKELGAETSSSGDVDGMTLEATVAVTPSQQVYFELWSGDTLITKNLRRSVIWVSSGNVSVPMDGESKIIIDENDLAYGVNVKNASWNYNTESSQYVDITWDNVFFGGSCLFDKVVVYYEPANGGTAESGKVEVTDLKGEKGSVTLENLETNVDYKIYIQAYHTNGLISSKDPLDGTITTKVVVDGISITPSSLESAIEIGGKVDLTATVTPENASDKSVTWTFDEEAFSADSDTSDSGVAKSFTAKKAGVFTIKAQTNDQLATVESAKIKVKVNPAAPTVEKESDNITVSWQAVSNEDATYTLYRTADSADAQVIGTQNMNVTSYEDKDIFSGVTYSYYVVATVGEDTLTSKTSTEVEMPESVIGITLPNAGTSLDINLRSEDGILALTDENSITLSAVDKDGYPLESDTYAWYVDLVSEPISESSTLVLNMEEHGQYIYPGDNELEITLVLTKGGRTYSGSVTVHVLSGDVPAESIVISLPEGQTTRLSAVDADGNLRKIPLTTVVTPNYTTEEITYEITQTLTEDSPIKGNIVDVQNGNLVFSGATGEVTIKAKTSSGKESNAIALSVYKATVDSAVQIVNLINTEWAKHFSVADSSAYFDSDWAVTNVAWNTKTYKDESGSFYFQRALTTINDGDSYATISNARIKITEEENNDIIVTSNGNIDFSLIDGEGAVTIGTEVIKIISVNNQNLTVRLPFNQGTATITYEGIRVKDDSGNNTRGGYYSVDFSSDILGIAGVNLDRTGDNKINDATEAANITKLIYG